MNIIPGVPKSTVDNHNSQDDDSCQVSELKLSSADRQKNGPFLKVYGERNTGTNYLSQLIKLNLKAYELPGSVPPKIDIWQRKLQRKLNIKELLKDIYFDISFHKNLGWKHSFVDPAKISRKSDLPLELTSFITITKNPYSWLLSLYKRPYHQYFNKGEKMDFETFITSPWKTVGRDNLRKKVSSPVELWNIKNGSYLQLKDNFSTESIRYEDLLDDPQALTVLICKNLSIDLKFDKFKNYKKSTKEKAKDTHFYRDYYLKERWKAKLSKSSISLINEQLDEEIMHFFRYEKLS